MAPLHHDHGNGSKPFSKFVARFRVIELREPRISKLKDPQHARRPTSGKNEIARFDGANPPRQLITQFRQILATASDEPRNLRHG